MDPAISIVIPTAGRPELLPAAVRSALASAADLPCEVIVVPNGKDESWRESLALFQSEERVKVHPIATPNANAARNAGMELARGQYLRFLDDDDTLSESASARQIELMDRTDAELCSGAVAVTDEKGARGRLMQQRHATDFLQAMVRPNRVCLPTAHVFRRSALAAQRWDPDLDFEQDTEWMYRLCTLREWRWVATGLVAGTWLQHSNPRTSRSITSKQRGHLVLQRLQQMLDSLQAQSRLDDERRDAFSEAFWFLAHRHFHQNPTFWARALRRAQALNPARRPPDAVFRWPLIGRLDPLLVELAMMPKRWLNSTLRATSQDRGGKD